MDGERKSCSVRILSAIEYGNLPNDETERRLCALIEAEVSKTDSEADLELIEACQSLLWQLHTHGEMTYESNYDKNREQIIKLLNREALVAKVMKSVGKAFVTAAAIVFVIIALKGDLRWSWLEQDNTPDQQQHVISGNEVTVELIQTAIAEYADTGVVQYTDVNALTESFNFIPMPESINNEWFFNRVVGSITPVMIRMDAQYMDATSKRSLIYSVALFTDAEDAYLTFEQSAVGKETAVLGNTVYIAENMERTSICWTKGLIFIRISGDFSQNDGLSAFEYLLKEWIE